MTYSGKFEPPDSGSWERDSTHVLRPVSRFFAPIFPRASLRGFKEMTAYYGLLLDSIELSVINGFVYMSARAVGAPKGAKGLPPRPLFKLLSWVNPEVRRRLARSREVLKKKLWRNQVHEWDERVKPRLAQEHQRILAIDPAVLSDEELATHVLDCAKGLEHALYLHHRFGGCAMLPVGMYLVSAEEWTGLSPQELLAPFRGGSPVSGGATGELERLAQAIHGDAAARELLFSRKEPATVLRELRQAGGAVGEATRAYVGLVGYRVISGSDVADLMGLELPEALVGAIRAVVEQPAEPEAHGDEALEKVRALVPGQHRDAFEELLSEARFVFRIRDERTLLNDVVMTGLTRRAILQAGQRLADRGRVIEASHAVELTEDELASVLRGHAAGPSREELAGYVHYRVTKSYLDAPARLGPPPGAPPPDDWLPAHAARLSRAVGAILRAMFETRPEGEAQPAPSDGLVRGIAVGGGTYEGVARLVLSPVDFSRVGKGDVLVARATTSSYNALLPLLGALVTDRGGLLSHPAIVAREYGLPAVVGCVDATARIHDGARVRVDGARGEVHVLSTAG